MMNCNIIGAGRLGLALAYVLKYAGLVTISAIHNHSPQSTKNAAEIIEDAEAIFDIEDLPPADITLITVPDDRISEIVDNLNLRKRVQSSSIVIHCSGVLGSDILAELKVYGCYIANFHPLKSFRKNQYSLDLFQDVPCVVEGDEKAVNWLRTTFLPLKAHLISIDKSQKALYHAAAVMASNYLITLSHISSNLLQQAGIEEKESKRLIYKLMQSSMDNLLQTKHEKDALTGPISRGDYQTISHHLKSIENPLLKQLYQVAGHLTLEITDLDDHEKKEMLKLLECVERDPDPIQNKKGNDF